MSDGRSNRKAKVVPFVDRLERDRNENLNSLVSKAKLMKLEGFESVVWEDPEWQVDAGRLVKLTGKNTKSASFGFSLSPKLGSAPLDGCWELVAKALFVLRFHRKYQSAPNQRSFIIAIGYVSFAAKQLVQLNS